MRAPSRSWFSELEKSRDQSFLVDDTNRFPIFPWLAPTLHPEVQSFINRWGVEKHLKPKDPVLGHVTDRVDQLVLVKSGITIRYFGSPYASKSHCFAFSAPGRLACGNLNFFTHRPCIGSYFAALPSTVVSVPQKLVDSVCKSDPEFMRLLVQEFEVINLTDRLGFGALFLLSVEERLLAFYLTWAANFGHLEIIDDEEWIRMPIPLRGEVLLGILGCSQSAIERYMAQIKQDGVYVVEDNSARIKLSVLRPIHNWIRNHEEKASDLPRDRLTQLLNDLDI